VIDCEPRFVPLLPEVRPGWSRFNPCIIAGDRLPYVNVRSSNYQIVDGKYVMPPEDGETILTDNIGCTLDPETLAIAIQVRAEAEYERTAFPVDGLEDVRLNRVDGECVVSATVRNAAPHDGTCRIGVAKMEHGNHVGLVVRETMDGIPEKNWMPILGRREWLYSCSVQGHTATAAEEGDTWRVTIGSPSPAIARGFRGGSQLVPVGMGQWLCIIHEVAQDGNRRIYEHRFVLFREDGWRIIGVSEPFWFREHRAIEFCAGLAVIGGSAVASFGVRDAEAWLAEFPLGAALHAVRML
jgi:hypothetical protein